MRARMDRMRCDAIHFDRWSIHVAAAVDTVMGRCNGKLTISVETMANGICNVLTKGTKLTHKLMLVDHIGSDS